MPGSFPRALKVALGVGLPALALIPAGSSLLDHPDPLAQLARQSDLIVLAEVMETARIPMAAGHEPRVARLRVREVWKGKAAPEIDVGFDPFVVWPEPPRYVPGEVIAHHYMAGERTGHTLQTTALVNEAFLRLVDSSQVRWQNRAHFMAVSAQLMRRILVDFARSRNYLKRGAGAQQVTLDEAMMISEAPDVDLVELDRALQQLAAVDARKSQVVELRFFGGLTEEEAAEVLKVSPETVRRDLRLAKTWLLREMDKTRK